MEEKPVQGTLSLQDVAPRVGIADVNPQVQIHREGDLCVVFVSNVPTQRWVDGDEVGRSYAAVCLVKDGFATQGEVASALGVARMTVYRWIGRYEKSGMQGLVQRKRGPKGPRILFGATAKRMVTMAEAGVPTMQIAARLGVAESAVRQGLKREGFVRPPRTRTVPLPGMPEAGPTPEAAVAASSEPASGESPDEVPPGTETAAGDAAPPEVAVAEDEPVVVTADAAPPEVAGAEDEPVVDTADRDPTHRSIDRFLARMGLLEDAGPLFGDAQRVPGAGVLLAFAALIQTGVFAEARKTYGSLGAAFYGIRNVVATVLVMSLLRIKRPEQLRQHRPPDIGQVLGLDRAPEVKTLRRKLHVMAAMKRSEVFVHGLAQRRAKTASRAMGFLYVDGHVRVYHGKHTISKAHVAQMRLSVPATVDHWVCDAKGEPLFVVTATPTLSLVRELPGILKEVRSLIGKRRRVTVVFDRGGWSPKLFARMIADGFDVLTYRKGKFPRVRRDRFVEHTGTVGGREATYHLAERTVNLLGGALRLREVVRLADDGQHQTSIVTSRRNLTPLQVASRMFDRWRQENFFKYMDEEFAIDGLVDYGVEPADGTRLVPNPARRTIDKRLARARAQLREAEHRCGLAAARMLNLPRLPRHDVEIDASRLRDDLAEARARVASILDRRARIPEKVEARAAVSRGEQVVQLHTEAKRLTDALKMTAYQAETSLLRLLGPHYARTEDEGRKLVVACLQSKGDLAVVGDELRVTLEPLASPNRTRALAALCEAINATDTRFPGSRLTLRFAVQGEARVTPQ